MRKDYSFQGRARFSLLIFAVLLLVSAAVAQGQTEPEGHFVSINGIEMYYESCGEGSPLVLLHQFGGSSQTWKEFVPELSKHYRLIIPDLRGHGRSTNPTGQFTHRQSALDIFALLDQLKIDRVKALGISTGGMTLIHMATKQPQRIEAMALIGATIYFPEEARAIMRASNVESLNAQAWERYRQLHKRGDDQIRALITQFHNFKDNYEDMNFTSPLLSTIKAKTLIVHGDRDAYFPVSIPVETYRSIPNAYLWVIPNGGHVPVVKGPPGLVGSTSATQREAFTQTTLEFLRGDWEKKNTHARQ